MEDEKKEMDIRDYVGRKIIVREKVMKKRFFFVDVEETHNYVWTVLSVGEMGKYATVVDLDKPNSVTGISLEAIGKGKRYEIIDTWSGKEGS